MSTLQERIAQFRKMTTEDPENELGHFRLGQLLMEANQFDDAVASFQRTLEISPYFSKVYQLLGDSLLKLERTAEAEEVLKKGYQIAVERGDRIPAEEMTRLLSKLGVSVAPAKPREETSGPGTGFKCLRPMCQAGNRARQLPAPPLPDAIGLRIQREICIDCWNGWFKDFSVKVINEMRLDLSTESGQREYDKYMYDYLGFDTETIS